MLAGVGSNAQGSSTLEPYELRAFELLRWVCASFSRAKVFNPSPNPILRSEVSIARLYSSSNDNEGSNDLL